MKYTPCGCITQAQLCGLSPHRELALQANVALTPYLKLGGCGNDVLIEIAEILGHKTLAMVRRYAHFTQAHTQGVVERMAQQFVHCEQPQEGASHGEL